MDAFFEDFMALLFPEVHAEIDWSTGFTTRKTCLSEAAGSFTHSDVYMNEVSRGAKSLSSCAFLTGWCACLRSWKISCSLHWPKQKEKTK